MYFSKVNHKGKKSINFECGKYVMIDQQILNSLSQVHIIHYVAWHMETRTQVNVQYEKKVHAKLEASYFSQRKKIIHYTGKLSWEWNQKTNHLITISPQ